MDENGSTGLSIDVYCTLPQAAKEVMPALFNELFSVLPPPPPISLTNIYIYPDAALPQEIQAFLTKFVGADAYYSAPQGEPAAGSAVPIEHDGKLFTAIFLAQSLFVELTNDRYHSSETVSTIIEELLHARFYQQTWERRGYLLTRQSEAGQCSTDVETMVSMALDEYVVNRLKSQIFDSVAIIDNPNGEGLVSADIRWGGNLAEVIDSGADRFGDLVISAATGRVPPCDAWRPTLSFLYRSFLEPLSRNAAFLMGKVDEPLIEAAVRESRFFREHYAPYWSRIRVSLERAYAEPNDTEHAIKDMVVTATEFLASVGVTYLRKPDGTGYVIFRTDFFDDWLD